MFLSLFSHFKYSVLISNVVNIDATHLNKSCVESLLFVSIKRAKVLRTGSLVVEVQALGQLPLLALASLGHGESYFL